MPLLKARSQPRSRVGQFRTAACWERYSSQNLGSRGQAKPEYNAGGTLYVYAERLQGRELERARQLFATATHRLSCQYVSGVNVKDRLTIGGQVHEIGSVEDVDNLRRTLKLLTATEDNG